MNIIATLKSMSRHSDKINGKAAIVRCPIEKSINRNAANEARRQYPSMLALLASCGGGKNNVNRYSQEGIMDM